MNDKLFTHPKKGFRAYSKSKLAQCIYSGYLSEQLIDKNIYSVSVHPGHVATNIWKGDSFLMNIIGPISKRKSESPITACDVIVEAVDRGDIPFINGKLIDKNGVMEIKKMDKELEMLLMDEVFKLIK
jgi:short-subunit dehydrogenase